MKPTWEQDGVRLYLGDCIESMNQMPAQSVHTCVTSPPYYLLRSYGCDKSVEIGSESTVTEYASKMVEVFRGVRRVLRDDGTLWLNLGSSYASGGMTPSPSPLLLRVPSCGSDGTESRYYSPDGHACLGSDDEPQDETQSRHGDTAHTGQPKEQGDEQTSQKAHDSETSDCGAASASVLPLASRESKTRASFRRDRASVVPSAKASASPPKPSTLSPDAHLSEDNSAYTSGTSLKSPPLVVRTEGKESFYSACGRLDCNGIGNCGFCWCSLAIPSLNVKTKDEINTPHLVAMALQADGWTLRQTIIWHKPNPMPESVTDRCTKSHEYIFLMTKSPRYFYDAEAIKEKAAGTSGGASFGKQNHDTNGTMAQSRQYERPEYNTRNKRSVWTVTTKSFKEAHFATFPPKLIEPCILAGTSEEGCCPECGQPLRRQLEISRSHQSGSGKSGNEIHGKQGPLQGGGATGDIRNGPCTATTTTGWDLECNCDAGEPVPCTVLDCFGGAGTSGVVAAQHRREAILCELNPEYAEIARKRIERELHEQRIQPRLFK